MVSHRQKLFWRRCRKSFRWLRWIVLGMIFLLLVIIFCFNRIGLPGFVKNSVVEKLRKQGFDLHIGTLRLRRSGLVAEDVQFGETNAQAMMQLSARRVSLGVAYAKLARFQLHVDSLTVNDGTLRWLSETTNLPPRRLLITNIQSEVSLLPGDQWALNNFEASFANAHLQLAARIAHASAIRDWPLLKGKKTATPGAMQVKLRNLAETFEKIHFISPPTLMFDLRGDAREPEKFAGTLILNAPDADTPWAKISGLRLFARLAPPKSNETTRAQLRIITASAQTRWATARNVEMTMKVAATDSANIVEGKFHAGASEVGTPWASTTNLEFTAQWMHSLTNPVPLSGDGVLQSGPIHSRWGDASHLHFVAKLAPPETNAVPAVGEDWGLWAAFSDYFLDFQGEFADIKTPKLSTDQIFCSGRWRPPELTIDHLDAKLEGGDFHGQSLLDVASRQLSFETKSHFDLQKVTPVLTEKARIWLGHFTWQESPLVSMSGTLLLPSWTNREPDWRAEAKPTVRLDGEFQVNDGTFRGVMATAASSHFSYSNMTWRLPDLHVTRPEGTLDLVHQANDETHEYYWHIRSDIDLRGLRPLFPTNQQRAFALATFEQPPHIEGEVRGRWYDYDSIGAQLHIAASNVTFRGQSVSSIETDVTYTNRVLKMIKPRADRGTQHAQADLVMIDWNQQKIFLTNGFSTADPQVIANMIGEKTAQTMSVYHFIEPPLGRVNGVIPLHDDGSQDLLFDLDGGPFQWWKFTVPHISGRIHWWGERLTLTEIHAAFYDGYAAGEAGFDFDALDGADFHFDFTVANANLHLLLQDLSTRTNHLEGTVDGQLTVTHANTKDWLSWQGNGHANLHDGLLWEMPVFGMFSPVFNAFVPGIGDSRFGNGTATYIITNSLIVTDDLELKSAYMRLQYRGTTDFAGKMDGHVEAELLRDAWLVGRLVSLVLWPVTKVFEYHVTGTLGDPKMEPLYVPKFLLMPLHPIRTLKDMMQDANPTNAPPSAPLKRQ